MVNRLTTTTTTTTTTMNPQPTACSYEKKNLIIAQQRETLQKYDKKKEEQNRKSSMSSFQCQQGKENEAKSAATHKLFSQPIPRKEKHQILRVINFTPPSVIATQNNNNNRQRCQKYRADDHDGCRYKTRNEIHHQEINLPKGNPKSLHNDRAEGITVKEENANLSEKNEERSNSPLPRNVSPVAFNKPSKTNSPRNLWLSINQHLRSSSSISTSPSNEKSTLTTIQLPTTINNDQASASPRKKVRLEGNNNVIEYNTIPSEVSNHFNESKNASKKEEMNHQEEISLSECSKCSHLPDEDIKCLIPTIPPIFPSNTNNQVQEKVVIKVNDHAPIEMNIKQEHINLQSTLPTTHEEETTLNMIEPFFVKILFTRRTDPSEVLVNELSLSYSKFAEKQCSTLGFLSLERNKLSGYTFERLRQEIKEDILDDSDDDEGKEPQGSSSFLSSSSNRSWRFYIPELGPVSLKQERKLGDIFKFLINNFGTTEVGDGSPFNALKVMIVDT